MWKKRRNKNEKEGREEEEQRKDITEEKEYRKADKWKTRREENR